MEAWHYPGYCHPFSLLPVLLVSDVPGLAMMPSRRQRDWRQVRVAVDGAAGGEAALHNTADGHVVIMALYRHVSRSSLLLTFEAAVLLLVKVLCSVWRRGGTVFWALLNTLYS